MNPYEVNLADIAIEVKGDLKIKWNGTEFNFKNGLLKKIRENGMPATVLGLVAYALKQNGKSDQEIIDWCQKAIKGNSPSVEFNAPEGGALNVVSKEKNPMMNQLVENAESESRSHITVRTLIFDTVTTGLPAAGAQSQWGHTHSSDGQPRFVELARVRYDNDKVADENDIYVYPNDFSMPDDTAQYTGISTEACLMTVRYSAKPVFFQWTMRHPAGLTLRIY